MDIQLSIEKFKHNIEHYVGNRRLGLVTNPSGVDRKLRSTIDILNATGKLGALYGLEHGVRGDVQAGEKVASGVDSATNLPVHSLYGASKKPTPEMLTGIDMLVFDIQDVGCRFYTYLYSLLYILRAASECDIPVTVLDHPNPIGGVKVEGNILDDRFTSFVGYPIPMRYGMTIGEMAYFFKKVEQLTVDLTVVTMDGYQRDSYWEELNLPWIPPSPNIPTVETALVYPGTCLVEGTNLSEGRGTTKPFEMVGAPFINGEHLALRLNAADIPGVLFRPAYFTPTFSKHQGKFCQGVQLHVINRQEFNAVATGLVVLEAIVQEYPEFAFIEPPAGRKFFFDLLAGTSQLREYLTSGRPVAELLGKWEQQREDFMQLRTDCLLYQ